MHLCVFEDAATAHLAPLSDTRAVFDLRLAARTLLRTIRDAFFGLPLALVTRETVADVTAEAHGLAVGAPDGPALWVNGRFVAHDGPALDAVRKLARDASPRALVTDDGDIVAAFAPSATTPAALAGLPSTVLPDVTMVRRLWDFNALLRPSLAVDLARFIPNGLRGTGQRHPGLHPAALLGAPENVYVGEGARVFPGAVMNAEAGRIVLDDGAEVHEGAVVRGPVYIGPGSLVKPLAFVEGVALGPSCKIGGEVHSTVFVGHSNKGHYGFVGNSYIGEWCNFGAGSDTSNMRNDYGDVALFDEAIGAPSPSGQQFLGLIYGDHAKCSIATTFNTGTVVGVGCNLYGSGFHDRHVPNFSWGMPGDYVPYRFEKFFRVAQMVLARRGRTLSDAQRTLLQRLAEARA